MSAPEATRAQVLAWAAVSDVTGPTLIGRRGYFRDVMGVPGKNDFNIYDDAMFLVTHDLFVPFNANVDPSKGDKNVAQLLPGAWLYRIGTHNLSKPSEHRYKALVEAAPVDVFRFGTEDVVAGTVDDRGKCLGVGRWHGTFGVNIHRGGFNTTGSLGCQTIHPSQWDGFIETVEGVIRDKTITYILTAREDT